MTKLAGTLPKGEANGLEALSAALVATPDQVHVVVALVDCRKITTDTDSGDVEPTARVRRIEAITDKDDRGIVLEHRTGKAVLPFELEEDLRRLMGAIDPHTGEVLDDGDDEAGK
ncbi:hypothetical protein HJ590_12045 [Naumannella sp. ID2617S]|nr:hypothetical protein [Naumannella sp. ID2617S]